MSTKWTIYKNHRIGVGKGAYCGCAICDEVSTELLRAAGPSGRTTVIKRFNRGRISVKDLDRQI